VTDSIRGVNCPYCRDPIFFTDDEDDYEAHNKTHPNSGLELVGGIDVRGWAVVRELDIGGRKLRLTRNDVLGYRIYPIGCSKCHLVYIARLDITNLDKVLHYEKAVRLYHPPSLDFPEVGPEWGFVGQSIEAFCADVKAIRNQFVREMVLRHLHEAGFDFTLLRGVT